MQEIVGEVVGAIARCSNLLENDLPLSFQLGGPKGRVEQNVGDEPECDALITFLVASIVFCILGCIIYSKEKLQINSRALQY